MYFLLVSQSREESLLLMRNIFMPTRSSHVVFFLSIKCKPNVVQDLSKPTNKALKKQRLENSVEQKVHQIQRITVRNGLKKPWMDVCKKGSFM